MKTGTVALVLCSVSLAAVRETPGALVFEPNRGQAPRPASFAARGDGISAGLSAAEASVWLDRSNVRLRFEGADTEAPGRALEPLASVSSYFLGSGPDSWIRAVPNYGRVRFTGVYKGVDLEYYADRARLEYDLRLAPGADPSAIRLVVDGARSVRLDEDGNLRIETADGVLLHKRPVAYQTRSGVRVPVDSRYRLQGNRVAFETGAYDRSLPLTIDPVLYRLGRIFKGVAVDSGGSVYYAAYGSQNNVIGVFAFKVNNAGAQIYSAFFAAALTQPLPPASALPAVAVNSGGSLYIAGSGSVSPVRAPAQAAPGGGIDGFVAKINPQGTDLEYSTTVGGSGTDYVNSIAVDASGAAYVTGVTDSTNFPVRNAIQATRRGSTDAFIAKIPSAGGEYSYATYFGGTNGATVGNAIAVDSAGAAYAGGNTAASDLTLANPFQNAKSTGTDGFLVKINAQTGGTPTVAFSTYFGSVLDDSLDAVAVDVNLAPYVMINNAGPLPAANAIREFAGGGDVYVARLNSAGSGLSFGTYIGGAGGDVGRGIAVDTNGALHLSGFGTSRDFPVINPAQASPMHFDLVPPSSVGGFAPFLCKLLASGSGFQYSMFLPYATPEPYGPIAVDGTGNAYVGGLRVDPGATPDPSVPTITAPTLDQTIIVPGVTLSWTPVAGVGIYNVRVVTGGSSAATTLFSGSILPAAAPSILVNLPNGVFVAEIRGCSSTAANATCLPAVYQRFVVQAQAPQSAPEIVEPRQGQVIGSSTATFTWNGVLDASRYEVLLTRGGAPVLQIAVPGTDNNTTYSFNSPGLYTLQVRACSAACGPASFPRNFLVQLPPPPFSQSIITAATVTDGNVLTLTWTPASGADLYQVRVVQQNTGPGGGALTVASETVSGTTVVTPVPSGPAQVTVTPCNGNGCGAVSPSVAINPPGPNPAVPILGEPLEGLAVDGPVINFAWSRIPGDNGSNTVYRLYVQDL